MTVETWRSGCDEEHPPYKGKLAAHQTLLTVSNVKHIHLGDCFKHHGYWAEFQGQIFQVPLPLMLESLSATSFPRTESDFPL